MAERRFPPPWRFEEANNACFVVKDPNGLAVSHVYFGQEAGRRAAAKLMTRDEARRIASNISKLPTCLVRPNGRMLTRCYNGDRPKRREQRNNRLHRMVASNKS